MIAPLSQYAKFHIEFMAYNFYDTVRRRTVSKFILWHGFNKLCLRMLERKKPLSRYILVDRDGWKNGDRLI